MNRKPSLHLYVLVMGFMVSANAIQFCDNDCKTSDGYFCVKDDPAAFSVCSRGRRIATKQCPTGLLYDSVIKNCNWPTAMAPGVTCSCGAVPATTTQLPSSKSSSTTKASQSSTTAFVSTSTAASTSKASTTFKSTTTTTKQAQTSATSQRTSSTPTTRSPPVGGLKRICYYTTWAIYRPGVGSYSTANVDPFMCTHIIVGFMNLNNAKISFLEASDGATLAALTNLRNTKNPALKVLVAIGGWNAGSPPFVEVVSSNASQDSFIAQAISFLRQYDLDGLDIDWEYPLNTISGYTQWMQKLRAAFENEAKTTGKSRLLLSAAVAAGQATIDWAYDIPKLSNAVDMLNLMAYDLAGPWSAGTGLNAGLHPQDANDDLNVEWCSNYWVKKGADPAKLMVGIPTYGHVIKLCNPGPSQTGMGSKTCGTGNPGAFTASAGFEAYYESCLKLQCKAANWTTVWNELGQSPYMYSGNQWISYETPTSIAAKVNWVKSNNFGGVMVWALDLDDFNDLCGSGVKSPLMATLVATATNQPMPKFNAVPKPTVDPCNPTGAKVSSDAGGANSATTTPANIDLNKCDNGCAKNGIYCVPGNSNVFYKCADKVRLPMQSCQGSLLFNYKTQSCDWPGNYPGCNCA